MRRNTGGGRLGAGSGARPGSGAGSTGRGGGAGGRAARLMWPCQTTSGEPVPVEPRMMATRSWAAPLRPAASASLWPCWLPPLTVAREPMMSMATRRRRQDSQLSWAALVLAS
jgi:hypothetical protein